MHLAPAARVDHAITHSSEIGQVGLGIAGIGVGAVVVVGTDGMAGLASAGGASTVGLYGSVANSIGKIVDFFVPNMAACWIATGIPSVILGPHLKKAARANAPDTITRGRHEKTIAEGSESVMLGREFKPMSRLGDRSSCGGHIIEGEPSILVGGTPSAEGIAIKEYHSMLATLLTWGLGGLSIGSALAKGDLTRAGAKGLGDALKASGFPVTGAAVKVAAGIKPGAAAAKNAAEGFKGGTSVIEGLGH